MEYVITLSVWQMPLIAIDLDASLSLKRFKTHSHVQYMWLLSRPHVFIMYLSAVFTEIVLKKKYGWKRKSNDDRTDKKEWKELERKEGSRQSYEKEGKEEILRKKLFSPRGQTCRLCKNIGIL